MLWAIVAVLLILWLLGFSLPVAGGLIHLLLVVALVEARSEGPHICRRSGENWICLSRS